MTSTTTTTPATPPAVAAAPAMPVPDMALCACGHRYAAHTYRNKPGCALCECTGYRAPAKKGCTHKA